MGKMKQNPRYNVISCRVSDKTKAGIERFLNGRSVQQFVHDAIEAKIIEARQAPFDALVRAAR
jgi:hypothetical protein